MRPLIFELLFNDDRKFIMEVTRVTVNSIAKWAVITRRNVPDYPAFKTDTFDSKEQAMDYYKSVVVETPLVSLDGQSPNPRKTLEEYKNWLNEKGLICSTTIKKKDGTFYVEAAHIEPKHRKGRETPDNILLLCPNHHKEFDFGDRNILQHDKDKIKFSLNGQEYTISLKIGLA